MSGMGILTWCGGGLVISFMVLGSVASSLMILDTLYGAVVKFFTSKTAPIHPKTVLITSIVFALMSCPVLYSMGALYLKDADTALTVNFSGQPDPEIKRINLDSDLSVDYRMNNPEIEHISFEEE